jgi:hypothetical protein
MRQRAIDPTQQPIELSVQPVDLSRLLVDSIFEAGNLGIRCCHHRLILLLSTCFSASATKSDSSPLLVSLVFPADEVATSFLQPAFGLKGSQGSHS